MFQKLEIFQMAQGMARHAGRMQVVAAQNMANADTPGFKTKTLTPFADTVTQADHSTHQKATRAGHLNGLSAEASGLSAAKVTIDETAQSDPNGNSVALEDEILRSVDAKRQHDRALAIYRSSLNILRTAVGRA